MFVEIDLTLRICRILESDSNYQTEYQFSIWQDRSGFVTFNLKPHAVDDPTCAQTKTRGWGLNADMTLPSQLNIDNLEASNEIKIDVRSDTLEISLWFA